MFYYKKLYQINTKQAEINLVENSNISSIFRKEVSKAIDTQKNKKAPEPDGISNEVLRYNKKILSPVLTDMFNESWILKPSPNNGLSFTSSYCTRKEIILIRVERTPDEHQPIDQAEFRKDYSVIDHIHVVKKSKFGEIQRIYNQITYYRRRN